MRLLCPPNPVRRRSPVAFALLCGLSAGLLTALLSAAPARADDQGGEYKIKLHRPFKVGHHSVLSATGESKTSVTNNIPNGPPKQENSFTAELDGAVKLLEVDDTGTPTKVSCTVDKLLRDGKSVLDKGTVVTAENQEGHSVYTVNGEKVEPPVAEALELVLPTQKPGEKDDDARMGTNEPQKVGGSWPVNAAVIAETIADEGKLPVKKENVKGTCTLTAVKKVNGKEVLQIDTEVTASDIRGDMPQGGMLDGGRLEMHVSSLLPVDVKSQPPSVDVSAKIKMPIKVQAPGGQEVSVVVTVDRSAKYRFSESSKDD